MRTFLLAILLCLSTLQAQTVPASATDTQTALTAALLGHWAGLLEYRDYAEPASSTKRVQLPTWLSIQAQPEGLRFEYIYDDGPGKLVKSVSTVLLDTQTRSYRISDTDHPAETYTISGLDALREGRGTLVLTGQGTDNKKPAEIRTTWTIRRNLLSWLEEVRPAGSESFVFRHRYTFTHAEAPAQAH